MHTNVPFRSLIADLKQQAKTFIREEVQLAKAEMSEKASRCAKDSGRIAAGGALAYAGLIVFLGGLGFLLAYALEKAGLQPTLAIFIGLAATGLLVLAIGGAMALAGIKAIKKESLVPEKTIETLQRLKGKEPTTEQSPQKEKVKAPSSEALEVAVLRTESELADTVQELTDRVTLKNFRRKANVEIRAHPYRWGLAAAGLGVAGGYLLERVLLHLKQRDDVVHYRLPRTPSML